MRPLALVATLALAPPALAQGAAPDSACTRETCALQIDETGPGLRLLRGGVPLPTPPDASPMGRVVGALGVDAPPGPLPVVEAVASSPAALAHAEAWRRDRRTAGWLRTGAFYGLALALLNPFDVLGDDARLGVGAGAVALGAASFPLRSRARRSLDRAVETYNAGLDR